MNNFKNISIFYFSGTGNTWYASEKLKTYLNDKNLNAKSYSIETLNSVESNMIIDESDIVIFGYPIYGSYVPAPMINFIKGIKKKEGKISAIFCTQMMFSGDGARIGDLFIKEKGFKTRWGIHLNMPNNLNCGFLKFLPITNDEKKLNKMMKKIDKRINKFSNYIINDIEFKQGFSLFSRLIAKIQRKSDSTDMNKMWKNCMSIDKNSCIRCGKCAKLCPSHNILKDDDGYYYTQKNCSGCLRCHNFCKSQAVMFKNTKSTKESYHGPVKNFDPFILKK